MKKSIKIIGIIVLFLILGLISMFITSKILDSKESNLKINEELTKLYPALINYSTDNNLVWDNRPLIDPNSTIGKIIPVWKKEGNDGAFYCGDIKAEYLEYKSWSGDKNKEGAGGSVDVIDCGKIYWVSYSGSTGRKMYGPFEK